MARPKKSNRDQINPQEFMGGVQNEINKMARHAALEVIKDLSKLGPAFTGTFRNSWVADAVVGRRGGGGKYPYTITHIPVLSNNPKHLKMPVKFVIRNTTPYAEYALDLKMGIFKKRVSGYAIKTPVVRGKRAKGLTYRGDVTAGEGTSVSTAELDWFITYINGGAMQKALERGVKTAYD